MIFLHFSARFCTKIYHIKTASTSTLSARCGVDPKGRIPATVSSWGLVVYLALLTTGFIQIHPKGGWLWDFWTINIWLLVRLSHGHRMNQPLRMQELPLWFLIININTPCTYQYSYQDGSLHTSIWMYYIYLSDFIRTLLYVNHTYTWYTSKNTHIFAGRLGRTISKLLGVGSQEGKVSTGNKQWGTVQIFCYHLTSTPL